MQKAQIELERTADGGLALSLKVLDPALLGHTASVRLHLQAQVKDKRPVHASRTLFERVWLLERAEVRFELPHDLLAECYSYDGAQLELRLCSQLKVDDALIFDSSAEQLHGLPLPGPPRPSGDDPKLMDPKDAFSLLANFAVLPPRNKLRVALLLLIGGFIALGNLVVGWHDEFVPEAQTLFYDHRGEDGSESPLIKALVGSGGVGLTVWLAVMAQLRRYMRFELKSHPPIRRGMRLRMADLVEGESHVALRDVVVRVIACNRECGAYKRGSGTSERTVTFKTPFRAVKLFERRILQIPARHPIGPYIDGEVEFDRLFDTLYPPLQVSDSHGIDIRWEVQLLHPLFVDQELEGDSKGLRYRDFIDGAT